MFISGLKLARPLNGSAIPLKVFEMETQVIERKHNFMGGEWVASSSSEVLAVINPVTEQAFATVPQSTAADVDRAAVAASAAFAPWSRTSAAQRGELFYRLARITEARADEITRTTVNELGYPASHASKNHVAAAVEELDIIARAVSEIAWVERIGETMVMREPSGVLGAITPWNAPLRSVISKAAAAMAAGCTVVLKPSEVAPLNAFIFAEMTQEAGIPPGVFNLVSGSGAEVGEPLALHPLVDMLSLTGSVRSGQRVMELASRSVKRVHLELGGKSANIIMPDSDFERAVVDGIGDALRNTGQACGGLTRMLVPRSRLKEAAELAVRKADSYVMGDPWDDATTLGPVSSAAARERVRGYIRLGQEEGAQLMTGGADAPAGLARGFFVRPTIFIGTNQHRVAREEIFGPVVVIIPFDSEEEAISIANDSPFGLSAGVWSASREHAVEIASRLRVGRVRINGAPISKHSPHGGFKLSGIGREWGRYGVEEFLEYKSVIC